MRLALIVAAARNGVIGRNGGLAWKISDDLKWFRRQTTGKPVIMGRRTFDSIGKALPDRVNIVVSRTMAPVEGVIVERTIEDALRRGAEAASASDVDEFFIIGGAELYASTLALADRIYLTAVDADVDGDARFPPIDPKDWIRRLAGRAEKSARNEHACEFFILDRR
ncbi:MAG: dihydrofolate reductase [Parvularculaceae bacterium]|nr:dihydrofolate reductase [Parvularculaceae bacterium]